MSVNRFRSALTVAVTLGIGVATASAQVPKEMSAYELVNVGPVAAPGACSCIANPFNVTFRPDPQYAGGPAAPDEATTTPAADPRLVGPHLAENRASLPKRAEEGLAGNPHASLSVAMDFSVEVAMGNATPRTEDEIVRWLYLASSQGHADAFKLLGYRYARGRGVAQDHGAAAYWFYRGATSGDEISMVALGLLYAAGRGVPQDWSAAVRWWERGQKQPLASRLLGDAYACGLGVAQDHARAIVAYRAAAEHGEVNSSTQLGHMYSKGCGDTVDDAAAVKAYERAADEGHPEAQVALSDLVRQGRGVEANPYRAYTYARLAELRLPDGELKRLATERVKAALRMMNVEAVPAQEALVQSLIQGAGKRVR